MIARLNALIEPDAPDELRDELNVEIVIRITSLQFLVAIGFLLSGLAATWYVLSYGAGLWVLLLALPVELTALASLLYWLRYRHSPRPKKVSRRAIHRIFWGVATTGALWGSFLAVMGLQTDVTGQAMMMLIAAGITGACVTFLFFLPAAEIAYGLLCTTPPTIVLAMNGTHEAVTIIPLYLIYVAFVISATFSAYRSFLHNLALRVENQGLLLKAEAANHAKSEFIAAISHELRTPLNAICGYAQLMAMPDGLEDEDEVHAGVKQILESGKYLINLVDDILDMAAVDSGTVLISAHPVFPGEVLQEILLMLNSAADECNISIVQVANLDVGVQADKRRLKQILTNLLSNAIKYNCDDGRIEIDSTQSGDGFLRICVRDTGMGIPSSEQQKILRQFGRATNTIGVIEGTGIGLYHSRRLTELMGGRIGVESKEGQGSTFWVEFPLSTVDSTSP